MTDIVQLLGDEVVGFTELLALAPCRFQFPATLGDGPIAGNLDRVFQTVDGPHEPFKSPLQSDSRIQGRIAHRHSDIIHFIRARIGNARQRRQPLSQCSKKPLTRRGNPTIVRQTQTMTPPRAEGVCDRSAG